jgi:integrase
MALTLTFDPYIKGALKLLLFTGMRRSEVLTLKWEHVDLDRGVLELQDSKTGAETIILNAPAIKTLRSLPLLAGSPYVFPGRRKGTHLVELPWDKLCKTAKIEGARVHDLRHSYASTLVSTGASLPTIGGLLGHSNPSTTQRYAHLTNDPARQAAEVAGEALEKLMDGSE